MSRHRQRTFEDVSDLYHKLGSETTAKGRREAGSRLAELLGNSKIRARLSSECKVPHERQSRAREKLNSVWRSAINASVSASEKAMEGRTKVTQEELALPFRLLKYCDGDLPKCGPFEEALPAAASEMDTLRNNGTKLDHKNIDSLLSYCLNALGNKKAILDAEYDLMGLLVMLCSRSD